MQAYMRSGVDSSWRRARDASIWFFDKVVYVGVRNAWICESHAVCDMVFGGPCL